MPPPSANDASEEGTVARRSWMGRAGERNQSGNQSAQPCGWTSSVCADSALDRPSDGGGVHSATRSPLASRAAWTETSLAAPLTVKRTSSELFWVGSARSSLKVMVREPSTFRINVATTGG